MPAPQRLHIGPAQREQQFAFNDFVSGIFRSADFGAWIEHGGWRKGYDVFALLDEGRIVASIGRTRMALGIDGSTITGYQLGAVATAPTHRGRGLSRELMQWALAQPEAEGAPVLLFANASVLDFYPRFGFRTLAQRRYRAEFDCRPALAPQTHALDLGAAADRACLSAACAAARVHAGALVARNYYEVLLWHLLHAPRRVLHLPDLDAVCIVSEQDGRLQLHDALCAAPLDLHAVLPRLAQAPVSSIEFGFDPGDAWPRSRSVSSGAESPLFVRGMPELGDRAVCFPDFAKT